MTLPQFEIRHAHGLQWIDRGPDASDDMLAFCDHEEGLRPIINSLLPEGGVFVDVGAHVGLWSLTLAARASKVYAFEANLLTYYALHYNRGINGLNKKVEPFNIALWDTHTSVSVKDWHGKLSGGSTACYEDDGSVTPALPLDEVAVAYQINRIDLIKIDTEGAEARVLKGARQTIERLQPNLLIEMHGGIQNVPTSVDDEVYHILKELNYETSGEFMVSGGRRITASPYTPWKEGEIV